MLAISPDIETIPKSSTDMLGFAALAHEMHGHAASIAMLAQELKCDKRRQDLNWLDQRLGRIHRTAAEMQRIINAVKRLEDSSPPERMPIDLSQLAARALQRKVEQTPGFERAEVRIQSNICIMADLGEVEMLLDNLIGNALKFSSNRDVPEVRVTATTEMDRVVVHVSDNGVGIAPEDTKRIFELFTRCHSGFSGSGVGLFIARRIVERHEGCIWAAGELGLGTTISFWI